MSDRALRRLVAQLAHAAPDDVRGVLDHLDPAHRDQVRALLVAYEGEAATLAPAPNPAFAAVPPSGLSPWLEARLHAEGSDVAFAMTPTAGAALRACVPAFSGGPRPAPRTRRAARSEGGLETLLARLRGRP